MFTCEPQWDIARGPPLATADSDGPVGIIMPLTSRKRFRRIRWKQAIRNTDSDKLPTDPSEACATQRFRQIRRKRSCLSLPTDLSEEKSRNCGHTVVATFRENISHLAES